MVALALYTVLLVMNIAIYVLIDMFFQMHYAVHTVEYKSNHYIAQKKTAVKKILKHGYFNS